MKRLWLVLALACAFLCPPRAHAAFAVVQNCKANNFSVSTLSCVFGSNVTSGNFVYIVYQTFANTGTLTFTTTGCTPVTLSAPDTTVTSAAPSSTNHAWGAAGSTGACTIVGNTTVAATSQIIGIEVSGSNNTVDKHGTAGACCVAQGFTAAAGTISAPALTTTVNGDFIIAGFMDGSANSDVFTAGGSFTFAVQTTSFGMGIETETQASSGSVTATATSSTTSIPTIAAIAIEPTGGGGGVKRPRAQVIQR